MSSVTSTEHAVSVMVKAWSGHQYGTVMSAAQASCQHHGQWSTSTSTITAGGDFGPRSVAADLLLLVLKARFLGFFIDSGTSSAGTNTRAKNPKTAAAGTSTTKA